MFWYYNIIIFEYYKIIMFRYYNIIILYGEERNMQEHPTFLRARHIPYTYIYIYSPPIPNTLHPIADRPYRPHIYIYIYIYWPYTLSALSVFLNSCYRLVNMIGPRFLWYILTINWCGACLHMYASTHTYIHIYIYIYIYIHTYIYIYIYR